MSMEELNELHKDFMIDELENQKNDNGTMENELGEEKMDMEDCYKKK